LDPRGLLNRDHGFNEAPPGKPTGTVESCQEKILVTIEVVAIPWYSSPQIYKTFRASADDAIDFFSTFEE
jgi:hypothetical protein